MMSMNQQIEESRIYYCFALFLNSFLREQIKFQNILNIILLRLSTQATKLGATSLTYCQTVVQCSPTVTAGRLSTNNNPQPRAPSSHDDEPIPPVQQG